MNNETNEERLAAHRKLHNIGIPPHPEVTARQQALGNCQAALQTAIGHLQAILNGNMNAVQMLEAEGKARDWLESIGSEPTR